MIRVVQAKDPETVCVWTSGPHLPIHVEELLSPRSARLLAADLLADADRAEAESERVKRRKIPER